MDAEPTGAGEVDPDVIFSVAGKQVFDHQTAPRPKRQPLDSSVLRQVLSRFVGGCGGRRHRDAVVVEYLFRQCFVARHDHPARVAAGVAEPQQLEVAHDVLIECADLVKRLHQVEHDVRPDLVHRLSYRTQLVS